MLSNHLIKRNIERDNQKNLETHGQFLDKKKWKHLLNKQLYYYFLLWVFSLNPNCAGKINLFAFVLHANIFVNAKPFT